MDYIDWPTLGEWLCRHPGRRLGPTVVAHILSNLADAQRVAHERGLPLGSLAPEDVHVNWSPEGEPQGIRISPFRIDALLTSRFGLTDGFPFRWDILSRLPPELYDGHLPDPAEYDSTGQYYLGLLGLELLRGSKLVEVRCLAEIERMTAFFFRNPYALFIDLANAADPWTERSPALAFVIARLLEREPSKRYGSAKDAARELGQIAEGLVPQSAKEEIASDYETVVSSMFAERFYSRLFATEDGKRLRSVFPEDATSQHMRFAEALKYNPGFEPSALELTFKRHGRYRITAADVDAFRRAFVEEIGATFPGAGRKREAWNVVLHHAFVALKRAIPAPPRNRVGPPTTQARHHLCLGRGARRHGRGLVPSESRPYVPTRSTRQPTAPSGGAGLTGASCAHSVLRGDRQG